MDDVDIHPPQTDAVLTRGTLVVARMAFALLGFSALVTEIATLVARGRFVPANFFSYFTIESNIMAVIILLVGSIAAATGFTSRWLDVVRGAVTLYMTTVLLLFVVLLSNRPADELTAVPWDNTVLHYVMPIAILLDWLLIGPAAAVPFRQALLWLVVPLAYAAYTLVRGALVGFYPYQFFDPAVNGYSGVLLTCLVIGLCLVLLTFLVAAGPGWIARARRGGRP
jgi:hypothetical protein